MSDLFRLDLNIPNDEIHKTSDDWYTPRWVFDALDVEFDLDVASPPGGIPWIPVKHYYTKADDGLAQNWRGKVWMNPPYSDPTPWVKKWVEHGEGVALIPTSTGKWMLDLWHQPAVAWLALPPMKFISSSTMAESKGTMPIRCWLIAIGDSCVEKLRKSGLGYVR